MNKSKTVFTTLLLLMLTVSVNVYGSEVEVKKNMIATVNSTVFCVMAIVVILPLWHNLAGC